MQSPQDRKIKSGAARRPAYREEPPTQYAEERLLKPKIEREPKYSKAKRVPLSQDDPKLKA